MTTRRTALALIAALTLTLGACGSQEPADAPPPAAATTSSAPAGAATSAAPDELLAAHGLQGLSTRQIIEKLDATPVDQRADDLMASVRPDALLLSQRTGNGAAAAAEPTSLPIEDERGFYLSVAPYRARTHDCYYHSLTTCLGELRNQPVHITVTGADGTVLVDEDRTTYDNGFVAVWLPRDLRATLTVTSDDKTATQPISTGPEDATCITTTQLT